MLFLLYIWIPTTSLVKYSKSVKTRYLTIKVKQSVRLNHNRSIWSPAPKKTTWRSTSRSSSNQWCIWIILGVENILQQSISPVSSFRPTASSTKITSMIKTSLFQRYKIIRSWLRATRCIKVPAVTTIAKMMTPSKSHLFLAAIISHMLIPSVRTVRRISHIDWIINQWTCFKGMESSKRAYQYP